MKKILFILIILYSNIYANKINNNFYKFDSFFKESSKKYKIPFILLKAIALTENTTYNKKVIRKNKNKTKDYGLMQINTIWLKEFKLSEKEILKPWINIDTSARILYSLINKYGYNWDTIGRYHSSTKKYKNIWLNRIKNNMKKIIRYDYKNNYKIKY